jgi:hypothetical protein
MVLPVERSPNIAFTGAYAHAIGQIQQILPAVAIQVSDPT